ncbi:MAG: methyltransferase domain-containing protein [Ginsengibacter sp.]
MRKLLRLVYGLAIKILAKPNQLYFSFAKSKVECNICHYKANRLISDSWHLYIICPNCGSAIRHRLLMATFEHSNDFSFKKIIEGKSVLHFAPERLLRNLIKKHTKSYKTADFLTEGYFYGKLDYNIDISAMPAIEDESFDCVIACDVLEHVPNHINGMKEVYRILKTGGHCIFTVPQKDNLKTTYEDLSIMSSGARKKAFGQFDHWRIYGDDFTSFLETCGFKVTAIDANYFAKEIAERNVLFPPVLSKKENVTNFRKVFIGVK